jgi:hypothetical protein
MRVDFTRIGLEMATSSYSQPDRSDTPATAPSVRAPAGLTTTSWSPRGELSVTDWVRQGSWLGSLGRATGWWIGDWLRYGNAHYGDRYSSAGRVTGYDVQSLMNMAYVAGRFEPSRRRDGLSFSHHAELAGLPADEQDLWLDRAELAGLSVRSLRAELRRTRQRAASRAALAEARRSRNAAIGSARANPAALGREVEPPTFVESGADATGVVRPAGSGSEAELVCPECGHHFAPDGTQEAPNPPHPGEGSDAPRPRLSEVRVMARP